MHFFFQANKIVGSVQLNGMLVIQIFLILIQQAIYLLLLNFFDTVFLCAPDDLFKRNELMMTDTELNAMAADAIVGFSFPATAKGIATAL